MVRQIHADLLNLIIRAVSGVQRIQLKIAILRVIDVELATPPVI
ncbi:hypothetical protein HAALTHF_48670n [Vreelandella aquamarina]|nr:hypothetical protein HAALTHF_48670n [Halomonas axialensis]